MGSGSHWKLLKQLLVPPLLTVTLFQLIYRFDLISHYCILFRVKYLIELRRESLYRKRRLLLEECSAQLPERLAFG